MAAPKYLLQEIEGQEPFLYLWTPVLAKKKNMRPLTAKEAKTYLRKQRGFSPENDDDIVEEITESEIIPEEEFISDEDEDIKILSELNSDASKVSTIDGVAKPLVVTQEDLLEKDIGKINRLRVKPSIEEYMLKKYKMPMIQMEEVEEMKQQAIDILKTLAAKESLYE